ncbi:unnamed protein product [Cylicocyclus nassatus]|uniref:Uncharacterized protein n=1 Tax=Cylicocyclus nassatus TaxID=53992 RepID=A0AA36MBS6_CYLNA|nr:unnamed protein product [Cylicocyclus nassatus]
MLADADDFSDNLDSSYGYAPTIKRKMEIEEHVQDVASEDVSYACFSAWNDKKKRNKKKRKRPVPHPLQQSYACFSAWNDKKKRNKKKRKRPVPHPLQQVSDSDASRLSAQLRRELDCEWVSTSLPSLAGAFTGDAHLDLLHMNDLLCSINLQLLVMQREILEHETAAQFRESGQPKAFGYEDGSNKEQLHRLMYSLSISSSKLCERIDGLNRALLGSKNNGSSLLSRFMLPASITVCVLGFLFIHTRNGTS